MMNKLIYVTCMLCLACGCTDDVTERNPVAVPSGETVSCELKIGVEGYATPFSGKTRASGGNAVFSASYSDMDVELVDAPEPATRSGEGDDKIYNCVVLQFNGILPGSQLVRKIFPSVTDGVIDTKGVNLLRSELKQRFVVIANVDTGKFDNWKTLEEAPGGPNVYSDLMGLFFDKDATSSPAFPMSHFNVNGSPRDALLLCGESDAILDAEGKQISVSLQRNVAKVSFEIRVENNAELNTLNYWGVSLSNLPGRCYFHTLARAPIFPDMSKEKSAAYYALPVGESVGYPTGPIPVHPFYYIPVNLQYRVPTSDKYSRRNNAPIGGTLLQIVGQDRIIPPGGVDAPTVVSDYVIYQIYLGGNFADDYSVSSNQHLTYKITLKGRAASDSNVVQFIPGRFGGKLQGYDAGGVVTTTPADIEKWQYDSPFEVYFEDAAYFNTLGGDGDPTGTKNMRWSVTDPAFISTYDMSDGFTNTLNMVKYTLPKFLAAQTCFFALNSSMDVSQYKNTDWYLPSVGELVATWTAASGVANTLSPGYWSSTGDRSTNTVYRITNTGKIGKESYSSRNYVRGIRQKK